MGFPVFLWCPKNLRALDSDLSGIMRAAQDFEWERIPFVLEAGIVRALHAGTNLNMDPISWLCLQLVGNFSPKKQHKTASHLQVRGECVDDFIAQAQDRTRNAQTKSIQAAWNMWKEQLMADQVTFTSDKIATRSRTKS